MLTGIYLVITPRISYITNVRYTLTMKTLAIKTLLVNYRGEPAITRIDKLYKKSLLTPLSRTQFKQQQREIT